MKSWFVCDIISLKSHYSAVSIEVKSGKDYTVYSALNTFVSNEDYNVKKAFVVSNERNVTQNGKINYIPIYYIMFFNAESGGEKLTQYNVKDKE